MCIRDRCVGDIRNAADCVACCGTHPSSAGQVGLVKIYKIEHYKGMFRIYFEAGKRALLDYDKKHDRITELGIHFSAGTDDLLDKVLAQEQRAKAVKDELNTLRQSAVASRAEEIRAVLRNGDESVVFRQYDHLKTGDLFNIGKALIQELNALLLILAPAEKTLLLFSGGDPDCGSLVTVSYTHLDSIFLHILQILHAVPEKNRYSYSHPLLQRMVPL